MVGGVTHDPLDDLVAGQAAVAVDQQVASGRADHERRVGGDQVEPLAGHGLEQRAGSHLDVVGAVEGGVEPGQPERALVDVGGHDVTRVLGQVERLDAAAGAEVERAPDRPAHGELGEGGRGRADPEHVVGLDPGRGAVQPGGEVAEHPEVAVVVGVRAAVDQRDHLVAARVQQPVGQQRVEEAGQGGVGRRAGYDGLEQEQPDQRLQGGAARRTTPGRRGLVAGERVVRLAAEQLGHGVDGVVGVGERVAQLRGPVAHVVAAGRSW